MDENSRFPGGASWGESLSYQSTLSSAGWKNRRQAMGLFDEVRDRVTALEAARLYGLEFDRSGRRARCIWHSPDRHPSLTFKGSYCRCFACNNGGSSIDLVAKLFGLSPLEAARKLDADFALGLADRPLYGQRPITGADAAGSGRMAADALGVSLRRRAGGVRCSRTFSSSRDVLGRSAIPGRAGSAWKGADRP